MYRLQTSFNFVVFIEEHLQSLVFLLSRRNLIDLHLYICTLCRVYKHCPQIIWSHQICTQRRVKCSLCHIIMLHRTMNQFTSTHLLMNRALFMDHCNMLSHDNFLITNRIQRMNITIYNKCLFCFKFFFDDSNLF